MKAISVAMLSSLIIIIMVALPQAQAPVAVATTSSGGADPGSATSSEIELLVRRSAVLNVDAPIARVALTAPEVADALVTSPRQLLIHGKSPGAISLLVWDGTGRLRTYEVIVQRDLSDLDDRLRHLFPGEPIEVASSGTDVVLSGVVSSRYVVEKAAEVAAGHVEKKDGVVNLLRQREGASSSQILLRVRFAEVNRNGLQELGASFFSDIAGNRDYVARSTTQQFSAPFFNEPQAIFPKGLIFSDYLNLFVFNSKENVGALIRALQTRGLFQSLAEPNLIALSGKEASLLAGGEFPYPVVQGVGTALAVTIQFKEFGIRLSFTPTDLGGNLIHLKIRPEVSSLDFSNAVVLQGFKIPALSTRRTETEVELRDGQTFAIAGLLNNTAVQQMSKVPGVGDIPILGLLFRSRAYQKAETELVVFITPQVVRDGSMGAATELPSLVEPFLGRPNRLLPPPPPFAGSPKYPMPGRPGAAAPGAAAPAPVAPQAQAPSGSTGSEEAGVPGSEKGPTGLQPQQAAGQAPAGMTGSAVAGAPRKLTKAEKRAAEKAHEAQRKQRKDALRRAEQTRRVAAEEAAKKRAVEEKAARERAAEERERAEKAAKHQTLSSAEQARREAAAAKKRTKEERRRAEVLAEADARLRAAQTAYQDALDRLARVSGTDAQHSEHASPPR